MTLRVNSNNIQSDTLATISGPRVSNIQITDSSYSVLDDTAVDVAGGYIKITGSNFISGCQVLIDVTAATTVTFVSSTEVRAQVPAKTAGTYTVYLVNPNGDTAVRVNGLTYSAFPAWSTGSALPNGSIDSVISIQLSAPSNTTVSYALAAGNTLPTGLTLSNVGLLSGTITGLAVETTYNFTVIATDLEYQDTSRAFSITITVGDPYWNSVTTLLSPTMTAMPFNDDASTNNFEVTINGDTKPNNYNPYTPGYYSAYFDAKTDYISVPATTALTTFTGDFTFEAWIYPSDTTITYWKIWDSRQSGATAQAMVLGLVPLASAVTGQGRLNYFNGTNYYGTGIVYYNQWTHIAFVRSGTTLTYYVNGVAGGTSTISGTQTGTATTNPIWIGTKDNGSASYGTTGYISNLRVVNGTAVYTGNFTPSTSPLSAITNTVLLTCQSNRFIDNSANNYTLTSSSTNISGFNPYTPSSSYSTYGSTYFDGTGDYLTLPDNVAFDFPGDFTIEAWVYLNSVTGAQGVYSSIDNSADSWVGITLSFSGTSFLATSYISGNDTITHQNTVAIGQWYHIAICRSGSTTKSYLNGVQSTGTTSGTYSLTQSGGTIGSAYPGSSPLNGYITDLRVIKGTAVYTSSFTPPTTPLTAVSGTSLLTCQSNQPANNNVFLDNSTNNFAITRNGNTTPGTFSPYGENWSNYFDGTGDYLSFSAVTSPTTGDFTVEFWFYNTRSAWTTAFDITDGGTSAMAIYISSAGDLRIAPQNQTTTLIASVTSLSLNTWIHFAIIRSSGSIRAYANGNALAAAISYTTSMTGFTKLFGTADGYGLGYVSNFRYTTNAVYSIAGSTITVPTSPLQPIAGTSLLTCQSPNIVDNSPNNFTITKNGDVSVQKFGPFGGTTLPTPYYSAYFDGTGDYLSNSTDNAALRMGSGDFTIEFWMYCPTTSSALVIYDNRINTTNNTGGLNLYHQSGTISLYGGATTNTLLVSGSVTYNAWNHVAIVRSGSGTGNVKLYINGALVSTYGSADTNNYVQGYLNIGCYLFGGTASNFYTGYISNFRMVKGTAVYTTAFTPPTAPLTAISGTSLLTCQSSTFIDNSTNNFTITANGDSKPRTFNPFTVTYSTKQSYTPAVYGGSMYFDGTGDYVDTASSGALGLGTSDFTVEGWFYATNPSSGNKVALDFRPGSQNLVLGFGNGVTPYYWNGTSDNYSTSSMSANAWSHVAWVRKSGNIYMYLNGVSVYSAVSMTVGAATGSVRVGADNTGSYSQSIYISDLRIVKGQALYTSNFVPQNSPLQSIKNTTLLLNGTSAAIYDSSEMCDFETVGDAKLSTTTVKFSGTTSMYFDGTGDYVYSTPKDLYAFGTGDFTVEFWFYPNVVNNTNGPIFDTRIGSGSSSGLLIRVGDGGSSNPTYVYAQVGSTSIFQTGLVANTWHHVAVTRASSSCRVWINGVSGTAGTSSTNLTNNGFLISRFTDTGSFGINAYISDLRITKGVARYTSTFTPPTSPHMTK